VQIRKSVITAAGRGVRLYPAADTVEKAMLPLIDRDGLNKPVIQIIAEEALDSGIEEIAVVCAPGDEEHYRRRFELLRRNLLAAHTGADWAAEQAKRLSNVVSRLTFVTQEEPLGYGHAVHCARGFVGNEPFLLLLSDHLYISHVPGRRCAQQLIDLACRQGCAVSAVHATPEHLVGQYGTLRGRRLPNEKGIYQIERILEKPSLSQAELELQVPGLRVGHYLCFFGMHVLTPTIFELLAEGMNEAGKGGGDLMLTPAQEALARREPYLAVEMAGMRYDIGARYGLLRTQVALALAGVDSQNALAAIVETLAEANRRRDAAGS
jgi:UTP--glucose-1-phosphate uridylyltransferase